MPAVDKVIDRLLASLHSTPPLRVWSLIVTFYGDAIVPRGGELWLGTITELMAALRIDERAVRAAMSRLAKDDWVERHKIGRRSFYALSPAGRSEFAAASERIYNASTNRKVDGWRIALLENGEGRQGQRERLLKAGFGLLAPNVLIAAGQPAIGSDGEMEGLVVLAARFEQGNEEDLVARAFDLMPLSIRYRSFVQRYSPLLRAVEDRGVPTGIEAMAARVLVIHDYRRIVLRDPRLPARLLPKDWPGHDALRLCAALYRRLVSPSDAWLKRAAFCRDGRLPEPIASYSKRFSGL